MAELLYFTKDRYTLKGTVCEGNYDDDTFVVYEEWEVDHAMKYGDYTFITLHGNGKEYFVNVATITRFFVPMTIKNGFRAMDDVTKVEFTDGTYLEVEETIAEIELKLAEGE